MTAKPRLPLDPTARARVQAAQLVCSVCAQEAQVFTTPPGDLSVHCPVHPDAPLARRRWREENGHLSYRADNEPTGCHVNPPVTPEEWDAARRELFG